jgi:hypothetical protein
MSDSGNTYHIIPDVVIKLPFIYYVTFLLHMIWKILSTSAVLHFRNPSDLDYHGIGLMGIISGLASAKLDTDKAYCSNQ